jgi:hypothetical protein
MIIAMRKMDYPALRDSLDRQARIIVLSCNNCARVYGLGGRVGLKALADKLEGDGFNVIRRELVGFGCALDLVAKRRKDPATKDRFEQADVILPLACEHGQQAIQMAFPDKEVPEVSKTLGIGWWTSETVRLTHCVSGMDLTIDDPQGMTLDEAARRLGFETGPF